MQSFQSRDLVLWDSYHPKVSPLTDPSLQYESPFRVHFISIATALQDFMSLSSVPAPTTVSSSIWSSQPHPLFFNESWRQLILIINLTRFGVSVEESLCGCLGRIFQIRLAEVGRSTPNCGCHHAIAGVPDPMKRREQAETPILLQDCDDRVTSCPMLSSTLSLLLGARIASLVPNMSSSFPHADSLSLFLFKTMMCKHSVP